VELLIAKGANVNVTDRDGFVPLHLLSGMNFGGDCPRGEIARILIRNGANVNVVSFCCGKA
jgi:ankyrin repeat protein